MTIPQDRPTVSLGHVIAKTNRLAACVDFYTALGLTRANPDKPPTGVAILQLRGGTDLVLIEPNHPFARANEIQESHVSYGDYVGPVDLLIAGKERRDLEEFREGLKESRLDPSKIEKDGTTGHHFFQVVDPDGRKVTVLTNHANYDIHN